MFVDILTRKLGSTIGTALLFILATPADSQPRLMSVYVTELSAKHEDLSAQQMESITEDLEQSISLSGRYRTLKRLGSGDLLRHIKNEETLTARPDLARQLRDKGAEAILFTRLIKDSASGEYIIYATLVRLDSTIEWKRSASLRQGQFNDRSSRANAISSLIPSEPPRLSVNAEAVLVAPTDLQRMYDLLELGGVAMEMHLAEMINQKDDAVARELRRLTEKLNIAGLRFDGTQGAFLEALRSQIADRRGRNVFEVGRLLLFLPVARTRYLNAASQSDRDQFNKLFLQAREQMEFYLVGLGLTDSRKHVPEFSTRTFNELRAEALQYKKSIINELSASDGVR